VFTLNLTLNTWNYTLIVIQVKVHVFNSVDVGVEDAIVLYDLTNPYFEEDLKRKCTQIIENCISTSNAFAWLKKSRKIWKKFV
jgi:hypothetical protein